MNREDIINKTKFRYNCGIYRLDWRNFEIYGDVILINTPKEDLFVLFDKNYNTIGVEKKPLNISKEQFVKDKYFEYCNFTDTLPFGLNLGYPFEEYTLKNIIDLSNRIQAISSNHGHSLMIKVNGDWYESEPSDDTLPLLSYIKFLGEKVKQYFLFKYQFNELGFDIPDIYSYLASLIEHIDQCVEKSIEQNKRPLPKDILSYIGEQGKGSEFDGLLYDVADLLMQDKGIRVKPGNSQELEKLKSKNDLSLLATKLLKLLDLTDEELKKKEELQSEELIEKQLSNLRVYINEDLDDGIDLCKEEKGPTLVKKKNNKK